MRSSYSRSIPLIVLLAILAPFAANATDEADPPKLLGRCTAADLDAGVYAEWYRAGYDDYEPHGGVLDALRGLDANGLEVTVVFGTWCGDSRREVPRIEKVLDRMGVPAAARRLIAVDREPGALKRSPGGEERGHEIYRVPTVLVRRGGREAGRIVEFPARSIERDLLAILSGRDYRPNYRSYPVVRGWLADGLLADPNVSPRGLAASLRPLVGGEGELHAAARVLQDRGQVAESVALFRANRELYPASARCEAALAEALLQAGDAEGARTSAARALELNREPDRTDALVELLGRCLGA